MYNNYGFPPLHEGNSCVIIGAGIARLLQGKAIPALTQRDFDFRFFLEVWFLFGYQWKRCDMSTLRRIEKLCSKHGISIYKLEKTVGIAPSTIRRWDSSSPTCKAITLVADYFGVSVDYLLCRTDDPNSHKERHSMSDFSLKIDKVINTYDLTNSQIEALCRIIENIVSFK